MPIILRTPKTNNFSIKLIFLELFFLSIHIFMFKIHVIGHYSSSAFFRYTTCLCLSGLLKKNLRYFGVFSRFEVQILNNVKISFNPLRKNDTLFFFNLHIITIKTIIGVKNYHDLSTELHMPPD